MSAILLTLIYRSFTLGVPQLITLACMAAYPPSVLWLPAQVLGFK